MRSQGTGCKRKTRNRLRDSHPPRASSLERDGEIRATQPTFPNRGITVSSRLQDNCVYNFQRCFVGEGAVQRVFQTAIGRSKVL